MERNTTKPAVVHSGSEASTQLFADWFDPIESGVREQVRRFIEGMIESELEEALARPRYGRSAKAEGSSEAGPAGLSGHRHGHRSRSLLGTFGRVELDVPRARLDAPDGRTTEWKSRVLPAYE